jgi:hypothetical protein
MFSPLIRHTPAPESIALAFLKNSRVAIKEPEGNWLDSRHRRQVPIEKGLLLPCDGFARASFGAREAKYRRVN